MFQIIPHQTELLNIIRFQKQMISQLQTENIIPLQSIPLWIPFETESDNLKLAGNSISSINIAFPQVDSNQKQIYCPVKIKTKTQDFSEKLILADFLITEKTDDDKTIFENIESKLKKICTEKDFPCTLNIFRIAETYTKTENTVTISEVSQSIWIKLKNNRSSV